MLSKFPGSDHSCRRRYVAKLLAERIIIIKRIRIRIRIRIKKYRVQGSCFRSNISKTVEYIRVPFSLLGRCKSHATKRCNPRLCSCYRFWDIVVANINNFPILLEQIHICRRTSSHGIIIQLPHEGWNFYIRGFCSTWRCPSVLILHFFETPHESRG